MLFRSPCTGNVTEGGTAYWAGDELYRIPDASAATVAASMVADIGLVGSPAAYPEDEGFGLHAQGLTSFGGFLYFGGYGFLDRNFAESQELYVVSGGGGPVGLEPVNPVATSYVDSVSAAGDRLFFWADDGTLGREPWVGHLTDQEYLLSVTVSGSGAVVSTPVGLDCTDEIGRAHV